MPVYLTEDSGSLDCTNRATVNTSAAVCASRSIDHMHIALLADSINRTGIGTSSTVDTFIIDCVSHGTFLLFEIYDSEKLLREFSATNRFCPAQTAFAFSAKNLQFATPYIRLSEHNFRSQTRIKSDSGEVDYDH